MRSMSPTWRMMVSTHWSNTTRPSSATNLPKRRRMRSAESWIGVSGFLISCAMRRATSAQAAERCAVTRSVMSSSVTTALLSSDPSVSGLIRTLSVRSWPLRCRTTWAWRVRWLGSAAISLSTGAISGMTSASDLPRMFASDVSSSASAARLARVTSPEWPTPMTPELTPDSTASVKRRRRSICSLAATSSARWLRSSVVILLKVWPSCARSPSRGRMGTSTMRLPLET